MKSNIPTGIWLIPFLLLLLFISSTLSAQVTETEKINASDASALDLFGADVDISGNYAIVGATNNYDPVGVGTTGSGGAALGAVYIFQRNPGGSWTEINKFIPAYLYVPETTFGTAVAIEGNLAAASAVYLDNIQDAVYIYKNTGGTWNHLIRLYEPIKGFGAELDISGNRVIIGAPTGGSGSAFGMGKAFIYEYNGDPGFMGWVNKSTLTSSDFPSPNFFGQDVAIAGDYAAVSAGGDIYNDLADQAVYIFERDGAGNWSEVQKLTAPGGTPNDNFGSSLSMQGNQLVIGASGADNGPVSTGAVYVYERNGSGVWTLAHTLFASDGAQFDGFGFDAEISGNKIISGAYSDDDAGDYTGSAYLFSFNGTSWTEQAKYVASDAASGHWFGRHVAITDYFAIAGATGDNDFGSGSGSAYIYQHRRLIPLTRRLILRIFPNPNAGRFYIGSVVVQPAEDSDELKLEFDQEKNNIKANWEIVPAKAKIILQNAAGKELLNREIELPFLREVDITRFGPGTYYVTIDTGELKETARVLVEGK